MSCKCVALLEAIERIEKRLSRLPQEIAAAVSHVRPCTLSATDQKTIGQLLPAINKAMHGACWTVADLLEHADLRDHELQGQLHQLFGPTPNRKVFGKLLARAEGSVVHGITLRQLAQVRGGNLWQVDAHLKAAGNAQMRFAACHVESPLA